MWENLFLTAIYLNAVEGVEGVYSHAACRKVCFLRVFLSMQLKEFTLTLLVGKSVFMGIYLNGVQGVYSHAACTKIYFTGIYLNAVEGVYSHAACKKVCFYVYLFKCS